MGCGSQGPEVVTATPTPEVEDTPTQEPMPTTTPAPTPTSTPEPTPTPNPLVGTDLFEQIYVPYASRDLSFWFDNVKEYISKYVDGSAYVNEMTEASPETLGEIKITNNNSGDYVYILFKFFEETDYQLIMVVSYYQASSNSEVSLYNYSSDGSTAYDKFYTHIIGEQQKQVYGVSKQREFLFAE